MLILFDQGTPVPLRSFLIGHTVKTAAQQGWSTLSNGDLLNAAEAEGFDMLLTTNKNLVYQQNLRAGKLQLSCSGIRSGRRCDCTFHRLSRRSTPQLPEAA
jgi:hypothetical protein